MVVFVGAAAHGGGGAEVGADGVNVLGVLLRQGVHVVRLHLPVAAVRVDGHLNEIDTNLLKLGVHILLHAIAQGDDDDDGRHADNDAQHGQQGADLADHQALEGQAEGLAHIHSAPTSSSSSGCTTAFGSWASPS